LVRESGISPDFGSGGVLSASIVVRGRQWCASIGNYDDRHANQLHVLVFKRLQRDV